MPIIRIEMFEGRTRDQKRAIVNDVTDAFCQAAGASREQVWVVIDDKAKEDWGLGGELAADKFPD